LCLAAPAAGLRRFQPDLYRRFSEWSETALWAKVHRAVLDRLGAADEIDWSRAIVDGASLRAKKGDH
jgi:hypothetical protein